jgi:hypothetical protein
MSNDETWQPPFEDDGTTLGPEEALRREIEKSKNLKVERLQMRDALEKLRAENQSLKEKNRALKKKADILEKRLTETALSSGPARGTPKKTGLALFLGALALAGLALAALLFFLSRP